MTKTSTLLLSFFTMSLFLMTSCEEAYDIPTGDFEDKLVINELFNNETRWSIDVSSNNNKTNSNTKIRSIENATVEIYDQNNVFIYELFHEGDGIYGREDYSPSPKRGYSVKVSAPGFKAVTATSFAPEKSKLVINNFSIIPNEKFEDVEVDFVIEDRSKLESYYIWEIASIEGDIEEGTEDHTNILSQSWFDELTNNLDDLIKKEREFLGNNSFGDGTYKGTYSSLDGNRSMGIGNVKGKEELINYITENTVLGKLDPNISIPDEITLNNVYNSSTGRGGDTEEFEYKYELRVLSISKELYEFYKKLEEVFEHNKNSNSSHYPLDYYTNVKGGGGIFAGFSESTIKF